MAKEKIILKGKGASAGIAAGNVRIIREKKDFSLFNNGEILVVKITNPSFVIIMAKSAAIITDTGSIMSHPAIVSRELGIPCVVATKNATSVLHDGQKVKVDGEKGVIYEAK